MNRSSLFVALFLLVQWSAMGATESTVSATTGTTATPNTTATGAASPITYKFNALLQAWTVNDNSSPNANLDFRLRRAELKASGTVTQSARYFVMLDPAKSIKLPDPKYPTVPTDGKILQDLGVGFTVVPGVEVVAGQFKTLRSAEGLSSSAELIFPERSLTARTFGDSRDAGMMLSYQNSIFKAAAMASNGTGSNFPSVTTSKDLSFRVDVNVTKQLVVGAYYLVGDFNYDKKGEFGFNARFSPVSALSFGAEFDRGRRNSSTIYGAVFDVAYLVTNEFQPALRYEILQPVAKATVTAQQTTLGVNYLLWKNSAKIQAAFGVLTNLTAGDGTPQFLPGSYSPVGTLAFQAAI